ncbi:MAG: class II fumarate hydratase [Pirellulales bacterium]|nr:class II fumarate hydratase [Pirellulales bacterium]
MSEFRIEHDSMGEVHLPAHAYYGAQTRRAVENFPISGKPLPGELIHALGLVKYAAAQANRDLGKLAGSGKNRLEEKQIEALLAACREVAEGRFDGEFPVDVYQTGSGTSSNMNANEVIANRAIELAGGDRVAREKPIHPNDHVNMGQSTNDVFPTAIHVAVAAAINERLVPALSECAETLAEKSRAWKDILKIGRTHLADATPMTLGQEIGGFARQIELSVERAAGAIEAVLELPVGGTAVGTGINTHPEFGGRVCEILATETGIPFEEAANHFEANAQRDGLVECHAILKSIAVTLFNVANNIRWLASGPRCGFYEIQLPDRQPGSSIMPGKVNPVLCESLMQVAARVMGNDQTISVCGAAGGQFQLNIMMPVMADCALESIRLMSHALNVFTVMCLADMEANGEACEAAIERSLALVTALNPIIGYEQAAALAKEAFKTGKTIRELCIEKKILPEAELLKVLDPRKMIQPK